MVEVWGNIGGAQYHAGRDIMRGNTKVSVLGIVIRRKVMTV